MIKVKEITPRKLSGRTSFIISYDYFSETINSIIKEYGPALWFKTDKVWEVSSCYIGLLLDRLILYDDIDIEFLDTETETISNNLTDDDIASFKFKPFQHQLDGINFILNKKNGLILDQPGLGKTNQIIWAAETLHRRGIIDHCLIVVCVNALKKNWQKEIRKFSNETSVIIGEEFKKDGTPKSSPATIGKRAEQLKNKIDEFFVIVNIETLRNDKVIDAIKSSKNKFGMIAVDEIHCCTKGSQQGNNLLKLDAEYKIGATGTLIMNSPISAYTPLAFTGNDNATLTSFKNQYCRFASNNFTHYQIVGYKNLDMLKDELDNCSIRRTKDIVKDLPPKTITVELLEMNEEHQKFYDAIKSGVKEEADKIELDTNNLLSLMTRLRQASVCPSILTTENIRSTKIERCVELVEDLMEQDEKVVIMSTYKEPVYTLEKLLEKYNPLICTGDVSDDLVSRRIDEFQNGAGKVIIGTMAKMGTGITLNSSSYMILLDEPYTWSLEEQVTDRIHRVNNTRPASVTVLVNQNTVDERVNQIVNDKKDLGDYIVDNAENALSESLRKELTSIIMGI